MLNLTRKEALGLLAALVLVVLAALVLAPYYPEHDSSGTTQQEGGTDNSPTTIIILALEAFFTGAIALYGVLSYRESRRSSERQLRAYVFIDTINLENISQFQRIKVEIIIKNFGATPAYNYRHIGALGIQPFPLAGIPNLTQEASDPCAIGPGGTTKFILQSKKLINATQIAEIRAGTLGIFAVGRMEYETVFNEKVVEPLKIMCVGEVMYDNAQMGTYNANHLERGEVEVAGGPRGDREPQNQKA